MSDTAKDAEKIGAKLGLRAPGAEGVRLALQLARDVITSYRDALVMCHTGPNGIDEAGLEGVAEYDAALHEIRAAIEATAAMEVIAGFVEVRSIEPGQYLLTADRRLRPEERDAIARAWSEFMPGTCALVAEYGLTVARGAEALPNG